MEMPHKDKLVNTRFGQYIVADYIGSGAYGAVYKGIDDNSNKEVAIKVLDLQQIEADPNVRVRQIRKRLCQTQSQLMLRCNSENVLKCFEVFKSKSLKVMIIQYCNGGTLQDEILKKGRIPQKQALLIIKQLISGLAELHKHSIIHRDLKAENILIHNGVYKIADFGFSKILLGGDVKGTTLGTIVTMAPQVMKRQPYGLKADIWSIGVIFYQMLVGKLPFNPMQANNMHQQIKKKNLFDNDGLTDKSVRVEKETVEVLRRMLSIDPADRISWQDLIKHKAFDNKQDGPLLNDFRPNINIKGLETNKQLDKELRNLDVEQDQFIRQSMAGKTNTSNYKYVDIEKITQNVVEKKKKQIDQTDNYIFLWARETHLQCLKTQFFLKQFIDPFEKHHYNNKNRTHIQFLYLLASRCFMNLSPINDRVSKNQNSIAVSLKENIKGVYDRALKKFTGMSNVLTKKEGQFSQIITDKIFKIFNGDNIKLRDKFLTGNETIDYSKQQQINFTKSEYIPKIIDNLQLQPSKVSKQLVKILQNYEKINQCRLQDVSQKPFEIFVKNLIK